MEGAADRLPGCHCNWIPCPIHELFWLALCELPLGLLVPIDAGPSVLLEHISNATLGRDHLARMLSGKTEIVHIETKGDSALIGCVDSMARWLSRIPPWRRHPHQVLLHAAFNASTAVYYTTYDRSSELSSYIAELIAALVVAGVLYVIANRNRSTRPQNDEDASVA